MNKKIISLFEIYLLIIFSVSFTYLVAQTNERENQMLGIEENKFTSNLRKIILGGLSGGLVSAQGVALWTCQTNVNGTNCQEYSSEVCNSVCTTNCFPGTINNFAECKLGTCFDPVVGLCSAGSPKFLCEQQGGQWSAQQPAECNKECCLINPNGNGGAGQSQFTTNQQCNYLGQTLGSPVSWVPVQGEVECLLKASSQARGACVLEFLPELQKYNCETTTQSDCISSGGDFYEGQLCTNPALNTKCELTQNTNCFDDLDGVYYLDSCGNRANIYDSSKLNAVSYWSNIVSEATSCLVGATGTSINNQASCGNCNYLQGSICGSPRNGVDTPAVYGNYVCRDLSCVDEWGNGRQNGESWCAFDGKIGVDNIPSPSNITEPIFGDLPIPQGETWCVNRGIVSRYYPNGSVSQTETPMNSRGSGFLSQRNVCSNETTISSSERNKERSVDLPGSSHYKKSCFDGEVKTTPCDTWRNKVCEQSVQPTTGYTTASCRINNWDLCLFANENSESLSKCEENPDCFLKHVGINSFKFDTCAPKYPPGFYSASGDDSENNDADICESASKTCTYIEQKGWGGWKCKVNCGCKTSQFTEAMNNLCSSLGDCGGKINLNGDFTKSGYSVSGHSKPKLTNEYIAGMQNYKTPVEGQSAIVWNATSNEAIFGSSEPPAPGSVTAEAIGTAAAAAATGFALCGPICAAAAAVASLLFGFGKRRPKIVEFNCLPWQPPAGGAKCDLCNSDDLPCTKYKCETFGKTCKYLNAGTGNEVCINIAPNDVTPPQIDVNPYALSSGFNYVNPQTNIGVTVKNASVSDGCLQEYSGVNWGILLNEPGQCKVSDEHTDDYEEMGEDFSNSQSNLFIINHTTLLAMPTLDDLGVSGIDPDRRGNYRRYVRCSDASGNSNLAEYVVEFCVSPANDVTAPMISQFNPVSPGFVGLNSTNKIVQFYTNEPATCRWSLNDKEYSQMIDDTMCNNGINQITLA
ncbi:hypothetical protein EXS72_02870, partial [Candidatus Pacearchaeota archaeon]|nr:hypothetical protein [Candidatus Pacearchaeota archaeon]